MLSTTPFRMIRPFYGLAAILTLTLSGCGIGKGEISGTVRFNGKMLSAGRVTVVSTSNPNLVAYSSILEDGSYKVSGCPSGTVKIAVQAVVPRSGGAPPRTKPGSSGRSINPKIPIRYADPATSGLEFTVTRGHQQYDIDLKP